jgi:hypothetical protein
LDSTSVSRFWLSTISCLLPLADDSKLAPYCNPLPIFSPAGWPIDPLTKA